MKSNHDELPIYESRRTFLGMYGRYLVYRDRIELRTMVGIYKISFADIEEITLSPSLLKLMGSGKAGELRGIKTDFADFVDHVLIRSRKGMIRAYRFTPDDPREFVYSALAAMRHYPGLAIRQESYNSSAVDDALNARA